MSVLILMILLLMKIEWHHVVAFKGY
jgi:hypothetical protein